MKIQKILIQTELLEKKTMSKMKIILDEIRQIRTLQRINEFKETHGENRYGPSPHSNKQSTSRRQLRPQSLDSLMGRQQGANRKKILIVTKYFPHLMKYWTHILKNLNKHQAKKHGENYTKTHPNLLRDGGKILKPARGRWFVMDRGTKPGRRQLSHQEQQETALNPSLERKNLPT